MPHNNEQVIDQWVEENGKTRFTEYDGTERKDGGNEVPDLDWDRNSDWDTADKDYADRENEDWDSIVEAIEGELSDQIEWLYYPTEAMFSQLETLAHQWAKDNTILPHIANEAIADCIKDIKRRKESLTDKDPAPKNELKRVKYTEYYGDNFTHLNSYDVYFD
jgi:hypothetical protein